MRSLGGAACAVGGRSFLVELLGGLVVLGAFLASNEAGQLEDLSGLHDGFEPLGDTSLGHTLAGEGGLLLGDDLARLGLAEVLLGEAAGGLGAGALPDLPLLADGGGSLDLLGLLGLLGDLSLGLLGGLLGGSRSGARGFLGRSLSGFLGAFASHFEGWCGVGNVVFGVMFGYDYPRNL